MAAPKRRKGPTPRKQASLPKLEGAILLYHEMRKEEDFEFTAEVLFRITREAATKFPGKPRVLIFTVEGHRNSENGFDHDSWELISNFIPGLLSPFLTEFQHPYGQFRMRTPQSEDIPGSLMITSGEGAEREATIAAMAARGMDVYDADEFAAGSDAVN